MSCNQELSTSKATVVRPMALHSFRDQASPETKPVDDSYEQTNGLYSTFVGDRFQNQFQSTRGIFETKQRQPSGPRSPKASVSGSTSPHPVPSSPVTERIEAFASLKQRFEKDPNNNDVQHVAPKATRHSSCSLGTSRNSWMSSSTSPGSSRRSSWSSTELNDKHRRSSEMSIVREKIAQAKQELAEANERREVADRAYAVAKRRITSSKRQSKSLREQILSMQELVERKQKKVEETTKRLGARAIFIEENRRAAEHYDRDIRNESEWVRQMTEKIVATREKRKATVERIRELVQRIRPLKAAIAEAETKEEKERLKARRLGDVLTKTTVKVKNARTLSAASVSRTSFKGFKLEDVHRKIGEQRECTKRARSDIGYLEYRRELLREQLAEYKEEVRVMLLRLNPYRQQRALGFVYNRLPMSEEL